MMTSHGESLFATAIELHDKATLNAARRACIPLSLLVGETNFSGGKAIEKALEIAMFGPESSRKLLTFPRLSP